jgi:hypothetical protein
VTFTPIMATASSSGLATFNVSLNTASSTPYVFLATDTKLTQPNVVIYPTQAVPPPPQPMGVIVNSAKATHLVVIQTAQPPASVRVGQTFTFQIQAQDSSGNADTSFVGPVTVTLSNNPGGKAWRKTARSHSATSRSIRSPPATSSRRRPTVSRTP